MTRVVVLQGGRSSEHEVSLASAESVVAALRERGHEVEPAVLDSRSGGKRRYLTLTAEQVRDAFARWLRPQALVEVTQGPAPQ